MAPTHWESPLKTLPHISSHQARTNTFHPHLLIFSFSANKCWLCGYFMPCRPRCKRSDKQEQHPPTSLSMQTATSPNICRAGATRIKAAPGFFISACQGPINSCFFRLRHTTGCVSISPASIIRQLTDDKNPLRRPGLLHTRLSGVFSF